MTIPNIWENNSHVPVTTNQLHSQSPVRSPDRVWSKCAEVAKLHATLLRPGWKNCPNLCRVLCIGLYRYSHVLHVWHMPTSGWFLGWMLVNIPAPWIIWDWLTSPSLYPRALCSQSLALGSHTQSQSFHPHSRCQSRAIYVPTALKQRRGRSRHGWYICSCIILYKKI